MSFGSIRKRLLPAAMAFALCVAPANARDWTTIRIGAEGSFPPFNYVDADQTLQGFEIDLAKAVCAAEQVTCTFVVQSWRTMIPALLAGKFDAVFASLSITEERRTLIAFSERYYSSPNLFVTSKTNAGMATTPEAMSGKTIGTQADTVNVRFLQELYVPAGARVKLYASQDEATLALSRGAVDAVIGGKFALLTWLHKTADGACCQVIGPDYADPAYFGAGIGAGVRREDADLKALIDRGLAKVRESGEYDRITAKYFPFSIY